MRRRQQQTDIEDGSLDGPDLLDTTHTELSYSKDHKELYDKLQTVQNKNNELENTIYSLRNQLNSIKKENRKIKFSVDFDKDKVSFLSVYRLKFVSTFFRSLVILRTTVRATSFSRSPFSFRC